MTWGRVPAKEDQWSWTTMHYLLVRKAKPAGGGGYGRETDLSLRHYMDSAFRIDLG